MAILSEWLDGIEYEVLHGDPYNTEVSELVYDSRKVERGSTFICMSGSRVDSHLFIADVIKNGASAIVIEAEPESLPISLLEIYEGIAVIRVASSREALAKMSAARFGYPERSMTMIAITGTKGKTTTAHMLRDMIESAGIPCGLIGTTGVEYQGKQIETKNTTPESYELHCFFRDMLESGCRAVVMETSSQGFKLHRTDGIVFDYGIFTNIEPDHIGPDEHADFNEYLYYKSCIFKQSRQGIINIDSEHYEDVLSSASCKIHTYGIDRQAELMAVEIKHLQSSDFMGVEFSLSGMASLKVRLGLPGKYNVYNALAAISVCRLMGIDEASMLKALRDIRVNGRMELAYRDERMSVIVDYAHNAMAMKNLLATLREYKPERLVLVFGCGGNRAKERRYGMGEMAAKMADFSILTADNSRYEKTEDIIADIKSTLVPGGGRYIEIADRREAIEYAMSNAQDGDMIVVIGKGHENYNEQNGVRTHFLDSEVIYETAIKLGFCEQRR